MDKTLQNFFEHTDDLLVIIYEGLIAIVGVIWLISMLREIIPAMLDARKKESPEFKEKVSSLIRGFAIYIVAALAPVWLPLAVQFFDGLAKFGSSITNATGGGGNASVS